MQEPLGSLDVICRNIYERMNGYASWLVDLESIGDDTVFDLSMKCSIPGLWKWWYNCYRHIIY